MKLKTVTSRLLKVVVVIAMFFSAIAINDYIASAEVNDDLSRSITSATIEGENNGSVEVNKGSVNKLTLAIEKDVTEKDKTSFTLGVPENVTISGVTMSSSSINGTTVSASVSKTADNMATVVFNQDALDMVQSITDASYKLNLQLSLDIIFGAEGQYKFNPSVNDVKDVIIKDAIIKYGNYRLENNSKKNAFLDSKFYNSSRMLGVAGNFHLVGFNNVNLNAHTNGNVLANNLYAYSNFGTNNYADEVSYALNYKQVNSSSASGTQQTLVVGSSNKIEAVDNNNALSINGTKIGMPYNIVQDTDSVNKPYISLDYVKSEIEEISNDFSEVTTYATSVNGINSSGVGIDVSDQNNRRFVLLDPDNAGYINISASNLNHYSGNPLKLMGFQSGHSGSIIINVDCNDVNEIYMPQSAHIYIDGKQQSTNEVTTFENGKVIWNFINTNSNTVINTAGAMTGSIIAINGTVNIDQNLNGTVIANNINVKAESHRSDFTGETRATFDAIKYVDGNIPTSSQQFTFKLDELVNGKWASKYSAQNNGQYVKFNDIYYKNNNGTHWYLISETNNNDDLYNYSKSRYVVRVNVTNEYTVNYTYYKVKDESLTNSELIKNNSIDSNKIEELSNGRDDVIFNNTTKPEESEAAFIKVSKTFDGLTDDEINGLLNSFNITVKKDGSNQQYVLYLNSAIRNGNTFEWKLEGLTSGTYLVKESNATVQGKDLSLAVNGENAVVNSNGEVIVEVRATQVNVSRSEIVNPNNDKSIRYENANIIVAKLTSSAGYFVWTKTPASISLREGIISLINHTGGFGSTGHGSNQSIKATLNNTYFFNGIIANSLTFRDGTISYNNEYLRFTNTDQWSKFLIGYSEVIEGTNADISFVNTYSPEKISVSGEKIWKDNGNEYLTRPNSITVNLLANGTKVDSKTVTARDEWKYAFDNLDKYDAEGNLINYSVKEDAVNRYQTSYDGYNIINTLTEKTSIGVIKIWNDGNNRDNIRPDSITINLLANGTKVDSKTVTAGDEWKYTFDNLDKYDAEGKEIKYTVEEVTVVGYTTTIVEGVGHVYSIINTRSGNKEISGIKTWYDNDNQDESRPESITINLNANGVQQATKVVSAKDGWQWKFEGLAKYDAEGKEIKYTITEEAVEGYKSEINGYDVVNTRTGKTEVSGTKTWQDGNNHDNLRPESITINLLANGKKVDSKTVTARDEWKYTFDNLDKYDAEGKEIKYTIKEESVEGYESKINGNDVVNTLKTQISGTKTWQDGNDHDNLRPESITINLLANGKKVDSKTVTARDEWKYTFDNLDKYDAEGKEIKYTIKEESVEGYESKINGNDVVNTLKTQVSGEKIWKDNGNEYLTRPNSITVNLLANGTKVDSKTVTARDEWKYAFDNLDKYDAEGNLINYSVKEDAVNRYQTSYDGYNIINTLTEKTSISVNKQWLDFEDKYGLRPDSIKVKLIAKVQDVIIDSLGQEQYIEEKKGWTCTFNDLPKYKDGVEIVYTVQEVVPDGYTSEIGEYDPVLGGYTIVNSLEVGDVQVTKNLNKYNTTADGATFAFKVVGVYDGKEIYNNVFGLTFKGKDTQSFVVKDLPVGTVVTVTEEYSGSAYKVDGEDTVTVTVVKNSDTQEIVLAEFNNIYDDYRQGHGAINRHKAGQEGYE